MPIKNYTTKVDVYESLGEIQGALAKRSKTWDSKKKQDR